MTSITLTQNQAAKLIPTSGLTLRNSENVENYCFFRFDKLALQKAYLASIVGLCFVFRHDSVAYSDAVHTFYTWRKGDRGFIYALSFDGLDYSVILCSGSSLEAIDSSLEHISMLDIADHILVLDEKGAEVPFPSCFTR